MRIIVTGASGNYGRMAVQRLLKTVDPSDLILMSRNPAKLESYASEGVIIRQGDFDKPESLVGAFTGGDVMLLISTARVGSRITQHKNAIDAAVKAGVKRIVYTSFVGIDEKNPAMVNHDHMITEKLLQDSGIAWTVLRDSQYADAVTQAAGPMALKNGFWRASAGNGTVAFVTRDDCVACAVAVLTTAGHENVIYDITGPELLSFGDVARIISDVCGKEIAYEIITDDELYADFDALGIPREAQDDQMVKRFAWSSDDMVSFEKALRMGYFSILSNHVETLLGRPPQDFYTFAKSKADEMLAAADLK